MDKDKAIKEIKQLKELLDSGILTQEEYDKKSADLKKIILDSENKKNESSEIEKEYWEQKVKENYEIKTTTNIPKKEELKSTKKLEVEEEVILKTHSNESTKDRGSSEKKSKENVKINITENELFNSVVSILLIFPSLTLFQIRENSLGYSMNYAFEKFLPVLMVCAIISLIIYGLRSLIIKKDGSYLTTFYITTLTVCVITPMAFFIGYFFGYVGTWF
jgi:hypothetical protein